MVALGRHCLVNAVLASFCCYDYGVNASEEVSNITVDQKDYCKYFSCVIVWWIAKIYQPITMPTTAKKVGY